MPRRLVILLLLGFVLTRAYLIWAAGLPINVTHSGDVDLYASWAFAMEDQGLAPYVGVGIEYPPGVLPFVAAPGLGAEDPEGYRSGFVLLMALVDVAAFAGLIAMARRTRRWAGAWLWTAATAILGPVVYLRLDIVPAAATVWAFQRLAVGSWTGVGGWLALGAAAKVYPGFLLPAALLASRHRRRFVVAAGAVGLAVFLPYVGALDDMWTDVVSFHTGRGIQAESTWGLAYLVASRLEGQVVLDPTFGSIHVGSTVASATKVISGLLAVGVVGLSAYLTARRLPRGDAPALAQTLYGTLALLLALGTVLSPQFVLWLIAIGAAAICFPIRARWPVLLLVPIAALTQLVFPFFIERVHLVDYTAVIPLAVRNLLMFAAGLSALLLLDLRSMRPPVQGSGLAHRIRLLKASVRSRSGDASQPRRLQKGMPPT